MFPSKNNLLMREYVLFLLAWPWYLCELTTVVSDRNLRTMMASNDLSLSGINLYNVLSFMINLLCTEGMCEVLSLLKV